MPISLPFALADGKRESINWALAKQSYMFVLAALESSTRWIYKIRLFWTIGICNSEENK